MSAAATLLKSQTRFIRRHPVGPVATLLGIALAVMAVVTVHLVSQTVRGALDAGPGGSFAHTHVLTASDLDEAAYFRLRQRWRDGEFPTITALIPVIDDFMDVGGAPVRLVGFDPLASPLPGTPAAPTGGSPNSFLIRDTVIASAETAAAFKSGAVPVDVIEADGGNAAFPGPPLVLADLPTAQRLLGREGQLDALWLHVESTRSRLIDALDALLPGIAAALPRYADPAVDGTSVTAVRQWNPASRFADALAFTLGALALLSLLMAALVAVQASFSNAARRRLEWGRLKAIGVSQRTLLALGVGEGCLLGALGTAGGIALGVALSERLLTAAYGADVAIGLDRWVLAKAGVCGLAVAALAPALALRRQKATSRTVHVLGFAGALAAVAGLLHGSLLAAFGALAGLSVVQMTHGVPLAGVAAGRLARLARSLGARANLRAAAVRVGELRLALGALSVAVATAIGMGVMVESLRLDFAAMLDTRLWPGIAVSAEREISDADVAWVRAQPGVRDVRRYADVDARLARSPARVSLATLDRAETGRYGLDTALPAQAMLNEVGARLLALGSGDTVTVVGAGERLDVDVGHVFRDFGAPAPRLILPTAYADRFPADAVRWQRLSVVADAPALPALAATLAGRFGASNVRNQADIRALAMDVFHRTFIVSRALTGVALAVAVIGLYAALTALQASRETEFRLLTAIGYGRGRIWRLSLAQTSTLGVVAALSAVPLGVAIAWLLCNVVQPLAFGWAIHLRLDAPAIAMPVVLGIAGAVLAGVVPAYRSSFGAQAGSATQ